jgi:hypothetical protein
VRESVGQAASAPHTRLVAVVVKQLGRRSTPVLAVAVLVVLRRLALKELIQPALIQARLAAMQMSAARELELALLDHLERHNRQLPAVTGQNGRPPEMVADQRVRAVAAAEMGAAPIRCEPLAPVVIMAVVVAVLKTEEATRTAQLRRPAAPVQTASSLLPTHLLQVAPPPRARCGSLRDSKSKSSAADYYCNNEKARRRAGSCSRSGGAWVWILYVWYAECWQWRPGAADAGRAGNECSPLRHYTPQTASHAAEGQHEYYNEHYHFALFYPSNLTVSNFDEGGGAMSLSFQNVEAGQGFQIFVVPYNASQVTPAQFKKDEPSGVRQGAHDVMIDGATAASFYSTDTALGETAEIWFIHGGYLFEVTTLKPLAAWLSEIMSTWQFI